MAKDEYEVTLRLSAPEGLFGAGDALTLGDVEISRLIQELRVKLYDTYAVQATVEKVVRLDPDAVYEIVYQCPACNSTNTVVVNGDDCLCNDCDCQFTKQDSPNLK